MSKKAPTKTGGSTTGGVIARSAVALMGVAFYFGLAVAAWGGPSAFFSQPAFIVLAIVTLALTVASLLTSGNLSPGEREDRGNRWVIAVLGLIGVSLSWVCAFTDRIGFWTIDGDTTRWVGIILYTAGGILRIAPVFVLGRRFSGLVAIQPGHTLVTTGLYGVIRNPSYLGLLINSLGWALAFRSGVGVLLTALTLVPLVARMNSEEKLLRSWFGDEYIKYCARTSRLIPGIY